MKHSVKRLLALSLAAVMVCVMCVVYALARPYSRGDTFIDGRKYTIYTALDKKRMALEETSNNIRIYASHWGDSQTFTISKVSGEWYKIVGSSGKVVDVYGINKKPGTNVFPCSYNGGDNQLWKFIKDGDGYRIQSKLGTFLDVTDGKTESGTNVQAYSETKTDRQLWYLEDLTNGQSRFYDTESTPNKPAEIPYWITTPVSKDPFQMLYIRAGETIERTIQVRGTRNYKELTFIDFSVDWAKDSVPNKDWEESNFSAYKSYQAGLSFKTAPNGDYQELGGINKVGAKRFSISADSGAAGLYRARMVWSYGEGGKVTRTVRGISIDFYIYVEPKA